LDVRSEEDYFRRFPEEDQGMYPVAFQADFVEPRNRLTTLFRHLLAIPWLIVAFLWALAAFVAVVIAWFSIVLTGRYPQGCYDLVASSLRYMTRVNGFYYLMTDAWPPFGGNEEPGYPVRIVLPPPLASYDRLKTGLRILFAIPVVIIVYLMSILLAAVGFVSWIVIVVTGKHPRGLFDVMKIGLAYLARASAYIYLLTETYPPLAEDDSAGAVPAAPFAG
jgi:hypothetical protein